MKEMYKNIYTQLSNGHDVVMLSLYESKGSTPRKMGAKMAYFEDGTTLGTIGGGAIEYDCTLLAKEALIKQKSFQKTYILNHNDAENIGMVCGGSASIFFHYIDASDSKNVEIFKRINSYIDTNTKSYLISILDENNAQIDAFDDTSSLQNIYQNIDVELTSFNTPHYFENSKIYIEPLTESGVVYIFGGGHVSQALCPMLTATNFRVVVYEDNEKFASKKLFGNIEKVVNKSFLCINEHINICENDYAVVLTRGHKSDNLVLSQIMSKHPSYLGVIGSKKKVQAMHEYLLTCGVDKDDVARIHSPIGIEIGAVTPAEIAISITAQLIHHRSKNR
ncbi:MAG: hypothetical protein E7513_06055 [Ruminococcaceae bacterium]|nr:hypothetical protein [Oscillospiraceae bacterium]